jgi:hypothetical protein
MQSARSLRLLILVLVLGAVAIVSNELRLAGYQSNETARLAAYAIFVFNTAAAIAGLWTAHRGGWLAYAFLSLACTLLIGASTPISALWTFAKLFT